jgi:hypothetical protein
MKPKGLRETTIAMCVMNIAGFVFVDPRTGLVIEQCAVFSVIMAITYIVLWNYWKGKNWARILVLITGIVAIINLFSLGFFESFFANALIIIEAIFGIFMLWWLNTKNIKTYFKPA